MRCLNCRREGIAIETQVCPQCGVNLPTLMRDLLPPGTLLAGGHYRIDYGLSQGRHGIIYQGLDLHRECPVFIKEFFPKGNTQRNTLNGDVNIPSTTSEADHFEAYQKWLQRFEREGQILTGLTHPGIIKVFSVFKERNTAYWVMEWLEGWTLREELNAQPGKYLSQDRVAEIMTALVAALETVHREGVYHLDLQPDNVILTMSGRITLVDFGSVWSDTGCISPSQQQTPITDISAYAPPELLAGTQVSAATDLFELGMMLHEMLTGTLPSAVSNLLGQDIWNPHTLNQPWQGMVTQALRLQPEHRPQDIKQWWQIYTQLPPTRDRKTIAERNPELGPQIQAAIAQAKLETEQHFDGSPQLDLPPKPTPPWRKPLLIALGGLGGLAVFAIFLGLVINIVVSFIHPRSRNPDIANSPANSPEVSTDPNRLSDAKFYYERGNQKYRAGDKKGAIADYSTAIHLNPDYADAYHRRGNAKYLLGDKPGALADYNKAIELDPDVADMYAARGGARSDLGDKQGALADYNKALHLSPSSAYAYTGRGDLKFSLGDKQGALQDYNQAIRINPNYSYAYNGRGNLKASSGDVKGAIADYDEAIRLDPKNVEAYVSRGVARYRLKDLQGSLADYNQVLTLDKKHATARSNIGFVQYDLGDLTGAMKSWQDALALDNQQPDPKMALATALYRTGRKEQALIEAEAALKLNLRFAQVDVLRKEYAWSNQLLTDFKPLREDPKFQAIVRRLQSQAPQQN